MRYLPNLISAIRLAAVPLLIWLAWTGAELEFAWMLVAAGITDILDGWLARKYGWVSKTGALLDSAADISIVLVVLFAMWTLHKDVFVYHGTIVWAILAVWSLSNLIGLYRYHRLPSFHTTSARIGLILFGVFALTLFFYGFVPWLLYACGVVCFLAGVESLVLVFLIDRWRPNLRGGIRALIRAKTRRSSSAS
jgi:cardiolipin synthase